MSMVSAAGPECVCELDGDKPRFNSNCEIHYPEHEEMNATLLGNALGQYRDAMRLTGRQRDAAIQRAARVMAASIEKHIVGW